MGIKMDKKCIFLIVWLTLLTILCVVYANLPNEIEYYETQRSSTTTISGRYPVTNIRVIDGDTIEGDINLPLNITLTKVMIRFDDFDAWESNRRRRTVVVTDKEIELGIAATQFLIDVLSRNSLFIELDGDDRDDRDVYGRILATAIVQCDDNAVKLKDLMKENDFIRDGRFTK